MYWCRTLGELALYRSRSDAEPLLRAGKSLAILVYVGLSPRRSASRDLIASLFWHGADPASAHHALRQALYRLRRAVGGPPPLEQSNGLLVCPEGVAFDCLEGERALAAGDAETAYALLRGPFLPGFSPDAGEVRDWMSSLEARFAECWLRAGEATIERAFEQGQVERAVTVAEELRHASPLDDNRVLLLLTTLDRAGQTRRALAEYEAHRSLLADALDDEPPAELQEFASELERSLEPLRANESVSLPFVGRSRAWSVLLDSLGSAERGECAVVLVEGDAGLGKTRLIEEFGARARARGATWLSGKCYEMERTLPLAVISHAVRSAANGQTDSPRDLAWLTGRGPLADGPVAVEPGDPGLRLRAGIVSWLEDLAVEGLVLLTCDDIHWADPASLRLLHFAREQLASARLLIVCSYRPAELSAVARRFAGSLASEGHARIVTLDPLAVDDLHEILSTLGHFEDPELAWILATDLHRHTGGNPLFVTELLEALAVEDVLRLQSGRWTGTARLQPDELPKTLRKALIDRVDALESDARFALDVMAALDERAETELVALVLEISAPKAEALLANLLGHRMLRRVRSETYEMAHDELRQLVYSAIPDQRRREIHARVSRALEERGEAARPGGAARLVRHFEQAGESPEARRYALAAADEAAAVGAVEARSSFMQLAEALAPEARAAGWAALGDDEARAVRRRSWGLAALAGVVTLIAAVTAVGLTRNGSPRVSTLRPWELGTLYVEKLESSPEGQLVRKWHQLVWPDEPGEEAGIAELREWPDDLPPLLLTHVVEIDDKSPTKIFREENGRLIQLTFGGTDDIGPIWSPDRRWIALDRGWKAGDDYRFNIFVIDSAGAPAWQVTDGNYQDHVLDWSPDGSRFAIARNDGGELQLWVTDVDGGRAIDLTDALDLPRDENWSGTFAPDGGTLAAVAGYGAPIRLIDLESMIVRVLSPGCTSLGGAPLLWSPDGRWLAIECVTTSGRYLSAISADGASGPHVLAQLPSSRWAPAEWVDGKPTHLARLQIEPARPRVRAGDGLTLSVRATTADGAPLSPSVRWETRDTALAVVDSLGFLRARAPGIGPVIASAGGFLTDTAIVDIVAAPTDTVLYETWEGGIDGARWRVLGTPLPETVPNVLPDGAAALLSNGDDRWPSGVLTRTELDLTYGLTIEFPIQVRYTGEHWQEIEAALTPLEGAEINGERNPAFHLFNLWITGPSPTYPTALINCNGGGPASTEWSEDAAESTPHEIVLQVRPDGIGECFLDGRRLGSVQLRQALGDEPRAALWLGGRSNNTPIYIGPVLVTRGLRH